MRFLWALCHVALPDDIKNKHFNIPSSVPGRFLHGSLCGHCVAHVSSSRSSLTHPAYSVSTSSLPIGSCCFSLTLSLIPSSFPIALYSYTKMFFFWFVFFIFFIFSGASSRVTPQSPPPLFAHLSFASLPALCNCADRRRNVSPCKSGNLSTPSTPFHPFIWALIPPSALRRRLIRGFIRAYLCSHEKGRHGSPRDLFHQRPACLESLRPPLPPPTSPPPPKWLCPTPLPYLHLIACNGGGLKRQIGGLFSMVHGSVCWFAPFIRGQLWFGLMVRRRVAVRRSTRSEVCGSRGRQPWGRGFTLLKRWNRYAAFIDVWFKFSLSFMKIKKHESRQMHWCVKDQL